MAKKHGKAKTAKKPVKAGAEKSAVQKTSKASVSDVGYWRIIRDSLKFSLSPDKLLLVYLLMVPALLLFMWLGRSILSLGNSITELASPNPSPAVLSAILGPAVLLVGYAFVLLFAMTLVRVGIIENANSYAVGQKKSILSSMKTAAPRFWPALGALILFALGLGIISGILNAVPYVGTTLSDIANIIISLVLFLFLQALVINGAGVINSFKESYRLFIRRPAEVILMVLAMLVAEAVMVIVMAIVFLPFAYSTIMSLVNASAAGALDTYAVVTAINANFTMLAAGIFVVAIIWVYMSIFTEAVKTLFYLRIRKL